MSCTDDFCADDLCCCHRIADLIAEMQDMDDKECIAVKYTFNQIEHAYECVMACMRDGCRWHKEELRALLRDALEASWSIVGEDDDQPCPRHGGCDCPC